MAGNNVRVPLKASDVTKEWLHDTLAKSCKGSKIQVDSLSPIAENAGLISGTFKAQASIDGQATKLFIKIGGEDDGAMNDFIVNSAIDIAEVKAYNEDLPKLVEFEKRVAGKHELEDLFPKIFSCNFSVDGDKRGFYIVMEDLTVGFRMEKFPDGLNFKQLDTTIQSMARFHAISYCYCQINKTTYGPDKESAYPKLFREQSSVDLINSLFPKCIKDFSDHPKGKALIPHLEKLSKDWMEPFVKSVLVDQRFLAHGDLWSNNVLFNPDNSQCKIFDWQFFSTLAPYYDFATFVYSCAPPDDMDRWLEQAFEIYYQKMTETCKEFQVPLPFTKGEFVNDCRKKGFAAFFGFFLMFYEQLRVVPGFIDRFVWVTENVLKHNPDFFQR